MHPLIAGMTSIHGYPETESKPGLNPKRIAIIAQASAIAARTRR